MTFSMAALAYKECNSHKKGGTFPASTSTQGCISLSKIMFSFAGLTAMLSNLKIMPFKYTEIQYSVSQQLIF